MNGGTPTMEEMHFFYDAQSRPAMVEFGGAMYAYQHNLQGDIVGILDNTGNLVVEYGYDAWGKLVHVRTLTTAYDALAALNPFRYRVYVWDAETGLYYLRSRYYNPAFGRFVSADREVGQHAKLMRNNVFAYCGNRVVSCVDPNGDSFVSGVSEACDRIVLVRFNFYYKKNPKDGEINGHMDFTDLTTNITYSFSEKGWSNRSPKVQIKETRNGEFRYFYHDFKVPERTLAISKQYFADHASEEKYDFYHNPCYKQTTLYLGLAGVQYEAELGIPVEHWNGIIAPDDFYIRYASNMTEVDTSKESGELEKLFGIESVVD